MHHGAAVLPSRNDLMPSIAVFSGGEIIDTTVTPIVATLQSAGRFDLVSADIGAGWYDNLAVKVEGLRGGSTVFSQIFLVDTVLAQSFALNFTDIDTVNFSARALNESTDPYQCGRINCTQFTVDNIVIAELGEPTDLALFAVGGLALGLRRRRSAN